MADYRSFGDYGYSRERGSRLSMALSFLLLGIGVGSLVAMLLTPKTGKQLRKSLRRGFEDARDAVGDFGEQAGGWLQRGTEWAEDASNKIAPIARKLKRDIRT